jgi:hypothetical protein
MLTKSEGVVLTESVTTAGGSISRDRLEGMRFTGGVLAVQIVTFPCVVAVYGVSPRRRKYLGWIL